MTQETKPCLIVITGPTATGKTLLGAALAKEINGEVVSADSMQIYKHMNIGTAKPTAEEMCGIAHHMIDIVSPDEDYSVARYVKDASRCVDDILFRGKVPVIVGGSGLYIDSLIKGRVFSSPAPPGLRRQLEEQYDSLGGKAMLDKLKKYDIASAATLHANDKKRIVRAFEVIHTSKTTISRHDAEEKSIAPRYNAEKFALTYTDRAVLYDKINKRVDLMIAKGLVDEVKSLLDSGIDRKCTSMQAIGYKEIANALTGSTDIDSAINLIKMQSTRYAKRQLTWLRRDENVNRIYWESSPDIKLGIKTIKEHLRETK